MVIFLLIVLIILFIYFNSKKNKQNESIIEYKKNLNTIELNYHPNITHFSKTLTISFTDMLGLFEYKSYNYPSSKAIRLFLIKRENDKWYCKFTNNSKNKEIENLKIKYNCYKNTAAYRSFNLEENISKIYKNEWNLLSDIFPNIESSYQKWVIDGVRYSFQNYFELMESEKDQN